MNKQGVLARLAEDKPRFHRTGSTGEQTGALAGVALEPGDTSWAVGAGVLRWIADHVTDDMVTLETGAGYTTVLLAAAARHHYCCTPNQLEADRIRTYLRSIGRSDRNLTFLIGSTDATLPGLAPEVRIDFAYVDGCHGYPFPALDWHYIDKHLNAGGLIGMDNAELRPVREQCEFLEENGAYHLEQVLADGYFVRFYRKQIDQDREWIEQPYSRAKKDPCDWRFSTRLRRRASRLIKPYLF